MPYHLFGLLHATTYRTARRLRHERGQGTVEYVALILLLAFVFAGVVKYGIKGDQLKIGDTIVKKLKDSIDGVGNATDVGKK
jgi:hypothetical protein